MQILDSVFIIGLAAERAHHPKRHAFDLYVFPNGAGAILKQHILDTGTDDRHFSLFLHIRFVEETPGKHQQRPDNEHLRRIAIDREGSALIAAFNSITPGYHEARVEGLQFGHLILDGFYIGIFQLNETARLQAFVGDAGALRPDENSILRNVKIARYAIL